MAMTDRSETSTTGAVADSAKQVASETAHQTTELARDAWGQARGLLDEARGQVRTQSGEQARRAAGGMRTWSTQIRALAEGRTLEAGRAGELAQTAGDRLQTWADRIEREGFDGVLDDVGRFARRRPGAFLVLCAGAGFAAGRVAKAAKAQQDGPGDERWTTGSPYGAGELAYAGVPSHAAPSITGLSVSTAGDVPAVTGVTPAGAVPSQSPTTGTVPTGTESTLHRHEQPGAY